MKNREMAEFRMSDYSFTNSYRSQPVHHTTEIGTLAVHNK